MGLSSMAAGALLVALLLGLGYTVKWFPSIDQLPIHRLKDIPASKDVFVGAAWLMVALVIPALVADAPLKGPSMTVAALFVFGLVYIRSVLSDIRDLDGDRRVGRETIPILLGVPATMRLLWGLTVGLGALLLVSWEVGFTDSSSLPPLGAVVYTGLYLALYQRRLISRGVRFDLLVDGVFLVAGLLTLLWLGGFPQ